MQSLPRGFKFGLRHVQTGDARLTLPAIQSSPANCVRLCEKILGERFGGAKAANQAGQFCCLLAAAVHCRKLPLLALGPVGTIPVRPVGWGKEDGSLHQKNNYPRKKWVKLAHSPFPTMRLPQLIPLTIHSGLFPEQPPMPKGKSPWSLMGKMTSRGRAFAPARKKALPKNSAPCGEFTFTPAKW